MGFIFAEPEPESVFTTISNELAKINSGNGSFLEEYLGTAIVLIFVGYLSWKTTSSLKEWCLTAAGISYLLLYILNITGYRDK